MKQADMNPCKTAWVAGRSRNVGAWSYRDTVSFPMWDSVGERHTVQAWREIRHYGVLMGRFVAESTTTPIWKWVPLSIGWGSVSDQQGCNKIVAGMGGWYYSRKGGASWVVR